MRFGVMPLSQQPFRVSTRHAKVTQTDRFNFKGTVVVSQSLLNNELRTSIWVYGLLWVLLVNRHVLCLAKGGCSRREDEFVHPMRTHCIQQAQRVGDVVAVVLVRMLHRLTNLNKRRKVQHCIKPTRQDSVQQSTFAKVPLYKITMREQM